MTIRRMVDRPKPAEGICIRRHRARSLHDVLVRCTVFLKLCRFLPRGLRRSLMNPMTSGWRLSGSLWKSSLRGTGRNSERSQLGKSFREKTAYLFGVRFSNESQVLKSKATHP